jgi:DNA (cytosine-5)-methyltransferase 1
MGWNNIFHCEWNTFGQKILKHHFPNSISYNDITKTDFSIHRGKIDILTGGFPCQPYSSAGKRLGKADERHLFPEMLRCIKEVQPRWVIGENVRGLITWNEGMVFHEVCDDLEREGYEVQSFLIPAASVGAPHQRYRIWFVAFNAKNYRDTSFREFCKGENNESIRVRDENVESSSDSEGIRPKYPLENREMEGRRLGESYERNFWNSFPSKSPICGGDDGLPTELDGITFPKWRNESIKAYGNAIVPQVAHQIFKTIQLFENKLIENGQ